MLELNFLVFKLQFATFECKYLPLDIFVALSLASSLQTGSNEFVWLLVDSLSLSILFTRANIKQICHLCWASDCDTREKKSLLHETDSMKLNATDPASGSWAAANDAHKPGQRAR